MFLLTLFFSLCSIVLPVIPDSILSPDDRGRYIATHYWDQACLPDDANEEDLATFLYLLPYCPVSEQYRLLEPLWPYFTPLIRKYLCREDSPLFDEKLYRDALLSVSKSVATGALLCIHVNPECSDCQAMLSQLEHSQALTDAIHSGRIRTQVIDDTEGPRMDLCTPSGQVLILDIDVKELLQSLGE